MIVKIVYGTSYIKDSVTMYHIKSYIKLLLLVSIFPIAMPQISNLSPLRGEISKDLPADEIQRLVEEALEFAAVQIANSQQGQRSPAVINTELEGTSMSHFQFRLTQSASEQDSICFGRLLGEATLNLTQELVTTFQTRFNRTRDEVISSLSNITPKEEQCLRFIKHHLPEYCPNPETAFSEPLCNPAAPYRTLNGSCNNLDNPEWGISKRRFNRYLQPAYEDGLTKMRGDGRAIPLPSARTVSAGLQDTRNISQKPPREDLTLMVMQWGQYLDHDLTHTAESTRNDEDNTPSPMGCCEFGNASLSSRDANGTRDDNCRPIDVSADPLYKKRGRQCMRFVRSLVARKGCTKGSLGHREQLNQLTSYLDASQVYGSDDEEAKVLRSWNGGLLNVSLPPSHGHGSFLPHMTCMEGSNMEHKCFKAGDVRVNEQPALTSIHTLWLRVHNNIANELSSLNPSWDDEMLYQETRRIVVALHQQITYREFLPEVHRPEDLRKFQLNLQDWGYDNSYNSSVDPTIANVFATAAFRFGHTLIAETFKGMGRNVTLLGNFDEPLVLRDPSTGPSALLQGLTACPALGSDAYITPTLINHLFSKSKDRIGFDLMALNIQRGRDHGLPPYDKWRQFCKLSSVNSFEDLQYIMDPNAVEVFKASYQSVADIDLFPAGLAEKPMPGGLLGPTFSCLLAKQFKDIKIGDRFWYENQNQPKPFTQDQLSALREQSLASIMCQHLELDSIQPMVFRSERLLGNHLQDCSAFPKLNLQFWSNHTYPIPTPNPKPSPTPINGDPPKILLCIPQGTPKSYLNWFYPICTPEFFMKNYTTVGQAGSRYPPKSQWCIPQGTPQSYWNSFYPICTPDILIKNDTTVGQAGYPPKSQWCIPQGTPKSYWNWLYPICTPDIFTKSYTTVGQAGK